MFYCLYYDASTEKEKKLWKDQHGHWYDEVGAHAAVDWPENGLKCTTGGAKNDNFMWAARESYLRERGDIKFGNPENENECPAKGQKGTWGENKKLCENDPCSFTKWRYGYSRATTQICDREGTMFLGEKDMVQRFYKTTPYKVNRHSTHGTYAECRDNWLNKNKKFRGFLCKCPLLSRTQAGDNKTVTSDYRKLREQWPIKPFLPGGITTDIKPGYGRTLSGFPGNVTERDLDFARQLFVFGPQMTAVNGKFLSPPGKVYSQTGRRTPPKGKPPAYANSNCYEGSGHQVNIVGWDMTNPRNPHWIIRDSKGEPEDEFYRHFPYRPGVWKHGDKEGELEYKRFEGNTHNTQPDGNFKEKKATLRDGERCESCGSLRYLSMFRGDSQSGKQPSKYYHTAPGMARSFCGDNQGTSAGYNSQVKSGGSMLGFNQKRIKGVTQAYSAQRGDARLKEPMPCSKGEGKCGYESWGKLLGKLYRNQPKWLNKIKDCDRDIYFLNDQKNKYPASDWGEVDQGCARQDF